MIPIMLQVFNPGMIVTELEWGLPIAVIIIIAAGLYLWRSSKKQKAAVKGGSAASGLNGGNTALILSPDKNYVVDQKEFYIHRETDPKKNVLATYALFPEEEQSAKNSGITGAFEKVKTMFYGNQSDYLAEEEKKGRVFDETLAAIKQGGGWITAYTLTTNTQVPIFSGLGVKDQIAIIERNVEKRMSILKSVQITATQFSNANAPYDQLGGSIKMGTFAIAIGLVVLALVLYTLPGNIQSIVNGAAGSIASSIHSSASAVGGSVP